MATAAKISVLIATILAIHSAQAADPATGTEPALPGSGPAKLHTAPPALDGAQLFATRCAICHKPAELARRLEGAADPKAASADMAAVLARHGRCDAAADMAIIDYLAHSTSPMR